MRLGPTHSVGDHCRSGHAGFAWVALERQCLLEWDASRGISPLPLKQWAACSGSAAGPAGAPLSQIRQEEMVPEAVQNICSQRSLG